MSEAPPNAPEYAKQSRARRVLEAVIGGLGLDAIGAEEKIAVDRVETIVREELGRRWVAPVADFAKIQIARLEHLTLLLLDRLQRGELKAIDRALKIFDRLDRYHGFSRANPVVERYGEEDREKLLDKINAAAARLQADKSGE